MSAQKILVIVPAYNEGENIKRTVDEIMSIKVPIDVLVVNDGSSDDTAEVAKQTSAFVISLPFNLGVGGAVQTGFQFALKRNYDIAVQVDGDGQHDVGFLDQLLVPIIEDGIDVSIGSRFRKPFVGYRSSFVRRIGIQFFAYLISFLTKSKVTDPTSGFRAHSRKAIKVFAQEYPHDFPEPEAIMVANRFGLGVVEVPVQMRKRVAGISSIRYLTTLYYMTKVTFAILLNMLKRRKVVEL